jgi:hypothetical protein
MAIISVGYDGAVTESQWSEMIKKIGSSEYGVVGINDWKVTSVTAADRTVSIATGKGWGHGVFDENTAAVQIQLDTIGSGSRWDLIVMKRDWTGVGGVSVFAKVNGTSAKEIPVGRTTGPGVIDEQPLALVQVTAGQTAPTAIVDLRVWAGNGGMVANDELALFYLSSLGSSVLINGSGKTFDRIVGPDGNPLWTSNAPAGYVPMFGFAQTLSGGVPPVGASFLMQAGTTVQNFDGAGYARINFPRPFPNGLLYVAGFNGDDTAQSGAMLYSSAGSIWGAEGFGRRESWVYTCWAQAAATPSGGSTTFGHTTMAGRIHRINWLAIGW